MFGWFKKEGQRDEVAVAETRYIESLKKAELETDPGQKLLKLEKIKEDIEGTASAKRREIRKKVNNKGDRPLLLAVALYAGSLMSVATGALPYVLLVAATIVAVYTAHSKTVGREPYRKSLEQEAEELMKALKNQGVAVSEMSHAVLVNNMVDIAKTQMREGFFEKTGIGPAFAIAAANVIVENKEAAQELFKPKTPSLGRQQT